MKTWTVKETSSKGYAIGTAFVIIKKELLIEHKKIQVEEIEKEIKRYEAAVEQAKGQLEHLLEKSDVFEGHLALVQDIALYDSVSEKIKSEHMNAEWALSLARDEFVAIFDCMDEEYMRERATDVKDVAVRLLSILQGVEFNPFDEMNEPGIIVATDLTPSDTVKMKREYILGFLTQSGSVTSHVSIIAKNMGIPCLVGVGSLLTDVKTGDNIIMDAGKGDILLNPDIEKIEEYQIKSNQFKMNMNHLEELSKLASVTEDGKEFELCANVGNIEDVKNAVKYQIDGVGLFRSEFLYMENFHFPTEDEQYEVYKKAAQLLEGKATTIRTLDIGGDKELNYFTFPKEENPFLGYRAIRISLDLEDVFKPQLRALLRASAFGKIRIMYPMIISLEELFAANKLLELCKNELNQEGISFDETIEVGMMIETPAAVMLVEEFAKYVDFFSIGTNDLTQYLLVADRGNIKIAHLYNSYHPAVLKAIYNTIQAGHNNNIKVGMCGEFASDEKAAVLLLGMGLDEFSMSPGEVARVKYQLRESNSKDAEIFAKKVLEKNSLKDVLQIIEKNDKS